MIIKMKTYYEVQVKYQKIDPYTGKAKKVTEPYLVDAVNFGDAEIRITDIMNTKLSDEFELKADKIVNITSVHNLFGDTYFKAKMFFLTTDDKGKKKKVPEMVLIKAENIKDAFLHAHDSLDYDGILSIIETKIVDVYEN